MKKYLEDAGVQFQFNTEVTNVIFDFHDGKKVAKTIECKVNGKEQKISLTENDLVFVTNGSCTEGTIYGDQNHAPVGDAEVRNSGVWDLWKISPVRILPLVIPRSSAPILKRPTGNLQLLPLWMTKSFLILRKSAREIPEAAKSLPAVS